MGGLETAAFQRQTARMHGLWREAGSDARLIVEDGAHHFGILRRFTMPGPLFDAVLALFPA